MPRITRRDFLIKGCSALGVLSISFNGGKTWFLDDVVAGETMNASLLTTGMNGREFRGHMFGKDCTLLTEVSLLSGVIKQSQIPMTGPHAPQFLPGGRLLSLSAHSALSLVLNHEHKVTNEIVAPEGYLFGGHSLILEDKGLLAIPLKKKHSDGFVNAGFLDFYDLSSFKLSKRIPVPSTFAHDLVRLDSQTVVLSQYGTLNFDFQDTDKAFTAPDGVVFLMQVVRPTLSFFDLKKFSFSHHLELKQTHGLNHIDKGPNGEIYAVSVQAVEANERGIQFIEKKYNDPNILTSASRDASIKSKFLSLPSPFAVIQPGGKVYEHFGQPSKQLRSQDLVSNPGKNWAAASFPECGTVGIYRDGKLQLLDSNLWNIKTPRGLSVLGESNYLGVCDQDDGLAVVDVSSLKTKVRVKFNGLRTTHLDSRQNI